MTINPDSVAVLDVPLQFCSAVTLFESMFTSVSELGPDTDNLLGCFKYELTFSRGNLVEAVLSEPLSMFHLKRQVRADRASKKPKTLTPSPFPFPYIEDGDETGLDEMLAEVIDDFQRFEDDEPADVVDLEEAEVYAGTVSDKDDPSQACSEHFRSDVVLDYTRAAGDAHQSLLLTLSAFETVCLPKSSGDVESGLRNLSLVEFQETTETGEPFTRAGWVHWQHRDLMTGWETVLDDRCGVIYPLLGRLRSFFGCRVICEDIGVAVRKARGIYRPVMPQHCLRLRDVWNCAIGHACASYVGCDEACVACMNCTGSVDRCVLCLGFWHTDCCKRAVAAFVPACVDGAPADVLETIVRKLKDILGDLIRPAIVCAFCARNLDVLGRAAFFPNGQGSGSVLVVDRLSELYDHHCPMHVGNYS
jgi:hypothetical protein